MKPFEIIIILIFATTFVVCQDCVVDDHIRYNGALLNDPNELTLPAPEACCEGCRQEAKCEFWFWNKANCTCAFLYNTKVVAEDYEFAGGKNPSFVDTYPLLYQIPSVEPEAAAAVVEGEIAEVRGAEAQSVALTTTDPRPFLMNCNGKPNTFYKEAGKYIKRSNIEKAQCCQICQVDKECLSWNWDKNRKVCRLNKNVGKEITKEGFYAGSNF